MKIVRGVLIWAIVIAAFSAFAGIMIASLLFPPPVRIIGVIVASGSASLILMLIERVPE